MRPQLQTMLPSKGEADKKDVWWCCADLATTQDGVVARPQLLKAGVSADQVRRWLRRGLLQRRYNGVYAVGHRALSQRGRMRAALLACGEDAVLSHAAAAVLWDLVDEPLATIDVTVPGRQCRSRGDIRTHQVMSLEGDIRQRQGLPLTSPAWTLIDLAATATSDDLERLVSEARVHNLLRPGELEVALKRAGHRPGTARTRAFLDAEEEPDFTRSKGERTLRRLLAQAQLPQPRRNVRLGRWPVDFLWAEEKLVVEFDGFRYHGHRSAFERDRRKDVELANAGYLVLRFTWRRLEEEPLVVIAAVAQALGRRRVAA
jgi:very-short-patch-repair endonuclease